MYRNAPRLLAACALLGATACTTPSVDRTAADIDAEARSLLGLDRPAETPPPAGSGTDSPVDALLARPLTREDAALVALLNSPAIARRDADLRLAVAAQVAASRPPNPGFSLERTRRADERDTGLGVHLDVLALVSWPFEAGVARRTAEATRLDALRQTLSVAQAAREAWVEAVHARAAATHARLVRDAADAGRLYAARLAEAGNASRLQQARADAFHAETEATLLAAEAAATAARERLAQVLGVADADRLQLPAELPSAPAAARSLPDSEQAALDARLDARAARRHVEATARALRLQRVTRFVNVLEVGYLEETSNTEPDATGYEVSFELPLFDFGRARSEEARARYEAALATAAGVAITARTDTRAAWAHYDAAWRAAAHFRDTVLPQQARITRELLLRWNGMLVGPFELLEQARIQAQANTRAQAVLRDFWLADARLDAVLLGAGPAVVPASPAQAATAGGAPDKH